MSDFIRRILCPIFHAGTTNPWDALHNTFLHRTPRDRKIIADFPQALAQRMYGSLEDSFEALRGQSDLLDIFREPLEESLAAQLQGLKQELDLDMNNSRTNLLNRLGIIRNKFHELAVRQSGVIISKAQERQKAAVEADRQRMGLMPTQQVKGLMLA